MLKHLFRVTLVCLLTAASAWAQQTSINGTVTDISGAAVVGAKVVAKQANGGATFSTITTGSGSFQFPSVTAADYTIQADAAGFNSAASQTSLLVGQVLTLNLKLKPASASSTVTVESGALEVNTTSSEVAGNVDSKEMAVLPLNGRNYMDLSMLVPGIRRNAITNYSPLGSLNGGKFQINLDGQQVTQNNADSFFGQPQYSRDAIAQFQIITNRFDATLGRSSQLVINAQTKSGVNNLHGSAFGFFRNSYFNSADPITDKVLPFSDQQYGGTVGGKIRTDRLWYFGSYEGEHQPNTVSTTEIGFAPVRPFSTANTLNNNEYLGRLDYQPSQKNHFFGRYYLFMTKQPYILDSGVASVSRGAKSHNTDNGFILSWNRVISANLVNQIFGGFNYITGETDPLIKSMELRFPTTTIGAHYNYPSHLPEAASQFRDDLYWLKGKHSIKTGVEYILEKHDGTFPQNVNGTVSFSADPPLGYAATFPNELDPSTWNLASLNPIVTTYVQGFGNFNSHITRNTLGFWIQDDWKIVPRFTLNYGLRYDNDMGIYTGSKTFINGVTQPTHGDNHEFGPRIGFAYDPFGKGMTVIRGGAGIYFADLVANAMFDAQIFNGVNTVQASISPSATKPINLANPFNGADTSQYTKDPGSVFQAIQVLDPNVVTPWAGQVSIGVQQAIGRDWTISADYLHDRTHHDWVRGDANLAYDPTTGFNQVTLTKPSAKCATGCISGVVRPNPHYSNILTFYTPNSVGSLLSSVLVGIQKRTSHGVTAGASYTYGTEKDNANSPFSFPNNIYNLKSEWGTSVDDQHHTLSVNGDYLWRHGIRGGLLYHYGSGMAYTTPTGGVVPTALGSTVSNRSFCAASTGQVGSICSHIPITAEISKLYNNRLHDHFDPATGLTTVDRNSFRGLPIHRVDANLAKSFSFHEHFKATTMIEAFNLLNHSNFGSYNSVITSPAYGHAASTSGVLAYYARMLQFSARFDF